MPWREVSVMAERREFIRLAEQEGANRRQLCRRFGISTATGYAWLRRWRAGDRALLDRSHRPASSPTGCAAELEAAVLSIRDAHPAWGARKLRRCLEQAAIEPPAASTVHAILSRHGRISAAAGSATRRYCRFEKEAANLLWQMDFKGWVTLSNGVRCHSLTMLDDHSRFVPCLAACADQQMETVQAHLRTTFRRYGLPAAMFVDNGSPWGDSGGEPWTRLAVWLLKLGVDLLHSAPYHPQSRGKNERFHRTLQAEVFALQQFRDLRQVQRAFDAWREVYNFHRPHQALGQEVPASRYRPSPRSMPERLPKVEYEADEIVRLVPSTKDYIRFRGRFWKVPQAFRGEAVAIRPLRPDGCYGVFFASHQIAGIDCRSGEAAATPPGGFSEACGNLSQ
jgi:transposase InsO family protein